MFALKALYLVADCWGHPAATKPSIWAIHQERSRAFLSLVLGLSLGCPWADSPWAVPWVFLGSCSCFGGECFRASKILLWPQKFFYGLEKALGSPLQ
uniref:Uncharacterized protein n=1 Tax=Candidozyma auris TaxID=498019 RepID=A0A0L0NYI0_CANAR